MPSRGEIVLGLFSEVQRSALFRDPDAFEALATLVIHSPALTQALARRRDPAQRIFLDTLFSQPAHPGEMARDLAEAVADVTDLAGLQTVLRRFRLCELARLAIRDLTGRADLEEVVTTLSALADASIAEALRASLRLAAGRHGIPVEEFPLTPVVIGMGKLGGRELNYSSDVDLIYLYQPVGEEHGRLSAAQAAETVFTFLTRALSEVTEDGLVFRVDLDLRPGGKDGAQAQAIEAALRHYLILGQPWERLALLKARVVAGDIEAGRRFREELTPFVFRRHLDYTSLEELKALKERFARKKRAKLGRRSGARTQEEINVKLGEGGIREVEFFVQALTLTFGGRLPQIRRLATLDTLPTLLEEKVITAEDAGELAAAYRFLRTVEHRVQLREMTQTQTLPRAPETRELLALSLGMSGEGFKQALAGHMKAVHRRFEALLEEPSAGREDGPAPLGFGTDGQPRRPGNGDRPAGPRRVRKARSRQGGVPEHSRREVPAGAPLAVRSPPRAPVPGTGPSGRGHPGSGPHGPASGTLSDRHRPQGRVSGAPGGKPQTHRDARPAAGAERLPGGDPDPAPGGPGQPDRPPQRLAGQEPASPGGGTRPRGAPGIRSRGPTSGHPPVQERRDPAHRAQRPALPHRPGRGPGPSSAIWRKS